MSTRTQQQFDSTTTNKSNATDTIVAFSSPPGRSPRGLIRICGPQANNVLATLRVDPSQSLVDRTLTPSRLRLSASPNSPSIPILLSTFAAPRTYTGHDMVELQCPGHPALLDRLVQAAIAAGCRLAEPGEFTFLAYLAGKLDLTQAEGISATIAATSDSQLHAATLLREGKLGRFAGDLVNKVGTALALVEAGIDFVDQDDVVAITPRDLHAALQVITTRLDELLANSRSWGAIEALPRVVLVGAPSAGKSTLFNALLGRTRAVISAEPGTTRDVLAEPLTLTGSDGRAVEVMLVDIAGLDAAANLLDEQAQRAARQALEEADLLLHIVDSNSTAMRDDVSASANALRVRSKCDMQVKGSHADGSAVSSVLAVSVDDRRDVCPTDVQVSAVTGEGLDALRSLIATRIGDRAVSIAADRLALQPRHENSLRTAAEHLAAAQSRVKPQVDQPSLADVELVAACLRSALDELAGLGGELTPDDVIGRVFATFCVGK